MTSVFNFPYLDQFSSKIPYPWSLVPVVGKQPYQKNWVKKECSRSEILAELESGKATGVGLKLGNGLLAIDIDGESAAKLLLKLSGKNSLIDFSATTAWTSGRPGRRQYLFFVEEKDSPRLRNLRIGTGTVGDDGKEECLEFRWLGTQSVLPPSIHPLTNKPYTWINNPLQTPPALAPEWLVALCESWHSEYAGLDEIDLLRFPSRLFPHFRRPLGAWLLARRLDLSRRPRRRPGPPPAPAPGPRGRSPRPAPLPGSPAASRPPPARPRRGPGTRPPPARPGRARRGGSPARAGGAGRTARAARAGPGRGPGPPPPPARPGRARRGRSPTPAAGSGRPSVGPPGGQRCG